MILNKKAFTIIELIIVIAIIALIAAAVFVSVDPAKRLGDAKDAVRASDALAIEKAIQKTIAEQAAVPVAMAALTEDTPYMLVTEGGDDTGTYDCPVLDQSISRIDLAGEFKNYLGNSVPVDSEVTGDDTGYYITRKGNSFYIEACNAYGDEFVAPSCDGFESGGYCWYLGGSTESCDTVCASHGGCSSENWNDDTSCTACLNFYGTASCSGSAIPGSPHNYDFDYCFYRTSGSADCSASLGSTNARICACNN